MLPPKTTSSPCSDHTGGGPPRLLRAVERQAPSLGHRPKQPKQPVCITCLGDQQVREQGWHPGPN